MIESLMPVSMPTTCGPSPANSIGSPGVTVFAKSAPVIEGSACDELAGLGFGELAGEDAAAHRAAVAQAADERAGVDAGDRGDAAVAQPVEPAALGGGRVLAVLGVAHDDASRVDPVGLHRLGGDPVVADQRIGEGDDLPRVAGVGDRLLVAGHRGVEDDLARSPARDRRPDRRRGGFRPRAAGSPAPSRPRSYGGLLRLGGTRVRRELEDQLLQRLELVGPGPADELE